MTKSIENILNDCNNLNIKDVTTEDDYEYDVPENNKPLINNSLLNKQNSASYSNNELTVTTNIISKNSGIKNTLTPPPKTVTASALSNNKIRNSNSPTIDSGISSSSLMSLNEITNSNQSDLQQLPTSQIPLNEIDQIEMRFNKIIKTIRETCKILFDIQGYSRWREKNNLEKKLIQVKISFYEINALLNEFYELCIIIKNNFLKGNVTIKTNYHELCYKLNEFVQKFNSNINILNTLKWDINILASNNKNRNNLNDELDENLLRLNYLIELIQVINDFNYQNSVFTKTSNDTLPNLIVNKSPDNEYSDAGDSEDDIYENDDEEWLKPTSNDKREQEKEKIQTNFSDQMLIKFYSKHIDDNFNDIKLLYETINNNLDNNESSVDFMIDLTNKLALSGHKLVFICDTLNRNLTNFLLKSSLDSLSNNLCNCLKLYVMRIKTCYSNIQNNCSSTNSKMIVDSLGQVFNCAQQLKQLIIKYL